MIQQISITEMKLEDVEKIKKDLQVNFDNFWNYEILKEEIVNNNSKYLVAKIIKSGKCEIIGFAGIKIILDEADIMNIVVKKHHRKKGIASLIMENLIKMAQNLDLKKLRLEVNQKNIAAINLYKKFKFEEVGIRKKYYNNTDDAILMEKII